MASERRRSPRVALTAGVEFIVDADVIRATSVDVSENGICFRSDNPIAIRMRFERDGKRVEKNARLVWARRVEAGMEYGYEFTEDAELVLEEF